jgi:hypothetical protein
LSAGVVGPAATPASPAAPNPVRPLRRSPLRRTQTQHPRPLAQVGKRIDAALADKQAPADDTTRAHLEECRERIAQVLGASVQVNEP